MKLERLIAEQLALHATPFWRGSREQNVGAVAVNVMLTIGGNIQIVLTGQSYLNSSVSIRAAPVQVLPFFTKNKLEEML